MQILMREISWGSIGLAVAIMAALSLIFAIIIVLVAKYMTVDDENEKLSDVRNLLAGANCGGCGKAGCDDFAKALCEGKADLSACNPTSDANKAKIAEILQIDFASGGEKVAVVKCIGGNECADKFDYHGFGDCVNQNILAGGRKMCESGCMGSSTCVMTCPEKAIRIENGRATIDKYGCIACGACVMSCPKKLIELIPSSSKVYVACSTHCKGKDVMQACKKGCIGCGLCAKNCPEGAITMVDNLPVIDYSKCNGCKTCVEKCPRKCIVDREL